MPTINSARKEIHFKVVYYGAALSGKTTNLAYIHSRIAPAYRGDLVSLATAQDRTLFFDFLPLHTTTVQGLKAKFQLYTVPGQVIYDGTRQLVLQNVDGVVFVADSHWNKTQENVASFRNLEANIRKLGLSMDSLPYVLQFNKRDLPSVAPIQYLQYLLNRRKRRVPSFLAVASTGQNVFSTLDAVTQMLLHGFRKGGDALVSDAGKSTGGGRSRT
jgi:signal recognition particle receptor subunit beta